MKMRHDDFEAWIRERSSGCMEPSEIDDLCKGDLDFDSGEYTFQNASVQGQWEAWQASRAYPRPPLSFTDKLCIAVGECISDQSNGFDALASASWDRVVEVWNEEKSRK